MEERTEIVDQPVRIVGVGGDVVKAEASERIGALWAEAGRRGLLGASPVYGVYLAYEDRLANAYRVVVGTASDREPGEGEEVVVLPAGRYAVLADEGPAAEVTARLWRHVWTAWDRRGERAFAVDWERHDGGLDQAAVEVFLGLKTDGS